MTDKILEVLFEKIKDWFKGVSQLFFFATVLVAAGWYELNNLILHPAKDGATESNLLVIIRDPMFWIVSVSILTLGYSGFLLYVKMPLPKHKWIVGIAKFSRHGGKGNKLEKQFANDLRVGLLENLKIKIEEKRLPLEVKEIGESFDDFISTKGIESIRTFGRKSRCHAVVCASVRALEGITFGYTPHVFTTLDRNKILKQKKIDPLKLTYNFLQNDYEGKTGEKSDEAINLVLELAAFSFFHCEKYDEFLTMTTEIDPTSEMLQARAKALLKIGKMDEALTVATGGLVIKQSAEAYATYGIAAAANSDSAAAAKAFGKAADIDSSYGVLNAQMYLNLIEVESDVAGRIVDDLVSRINQVARTGEDLVAKIEKDRIEMEARTAGPIKAGFELILRRANKELDKNAK